MQTPLAGLRPTGVPALRVTAGRASPLPSLSLTGITGVIAPPPAGVPGPADGLIIDLRGSYGGAQGVAVDREGARRSRTRATGKLALRAEQFSLGRIRDVLPPSVLTPENTTLDAALDLAWAGDAVSFGGELAVVGLSLHHESLAADADRERLARAARWRAPRTRPRGGWSWSASRGGSATSRRGCRAASRCRRAPSSSRTDASWTWCRRSRSRSRCRACPCAKLLTSIPPALVPHLQGFELKGNFAADVGAKIDFADLDALELTGKVGIDGCKVVKAPPEVVALDGKQQGKESIVVNVEVPKKLGAPASPEPGHAVGGRSGRTTRTSCPTRRSRRTWSGRS